ncbi:MAG: 3-deoxy-D-manno-octulosonic acid transferase [Desulfuromonadaceae bacterium]|nr:3-deoxy-D-manno-octulosonic acid transferase [Desulfuromonadaceae bacterium]
MVYLLYDLILCLTGLVLIPCYAVRGLVRGKARQGIRERFGLFAPGRLDALRGRSVIWLHAVSVGETRAAIPLVKTLRQAYPDAALVLSSVTETGREIALGIKEVDVTLFFPVDLSWVVRRVLSLVRPELVLIVETELWPQFIRHCHRRHIPVVLVNGRISDRSFPRYRKVRRLLKPLMHQVCGFCMQSELDARRIAELGAPPQRIQVTGNLKFDLDATQLPVETPQQLRTEFGLDDAVPIWVAGSTHEGEEERIVAVYQTLIAQGRKLLLILVPRHPHRVRQVTAHLDAQGLSWRLRSAPVEQTLQSGQVLVVDTIGEMLKFYRLAEVVFVGGSLVPVGGHNVLEASLLQKPVLFGPFMHNFREIAAWVEKAQGFGRIEDDEALLRLMCQLFDQPTLRQQAGQDGWKLLQRHAGASRRTLDALRPWLSLPPAGGA